MAIKAPSELFLDWLAQRPRDARVAVVVDPDRFLTDANLLGKAGLVDAAGRDWQLAVFRGDDLGFRLAFRTAASRGRTAIVLTRGADTDAPIDVTFVADILAKNEAGPPLDLSALAVFRGIAPKINCPARELRRFRHDLLARLDQAQEAAEKLVQRWGRPDSWGRGQVAAMVLLAYHPEAVLSDIWPDETGPAEFLAHVVRLLVAMPQLRPRLALVRQVIREAAREQVRELLFWANAEPQELAAYLVVRDLAAHAKLQNPATQLAGLQIFSPDLSLDAMEPYALGVIELLKRQDRLWGTVGQSADAFLTPRRAAKVAGLLPPASGPGDDPSSLVGMEIPAVLRQHVVSALGGFFASPSLAALAWAPSLMNHPLLTDKATLTDRARQCRAGMRVLLGLHAIEQRLAASVPKVQHADALLDWYVRQEHHLLELDVSRVAHALAELDDDTVTGPGMHYLFGGDEQWPSPGSLKGRIVARLEQLNHVLADFVRQDPEGFAQGARSLRGFLRETIPVDQIAADTLPGRVWVLIFDGMRLDTWETVVRPILAESFEVDGAPYFCLLPSYTSVARTGLLAGGDPSEWKGFKGKFSTDEAQLFAVNMGLTAQEMKAKLRFVTGADTTKARKKMGFVDSNAPLLNVLIYPISDEDAHAFEGDLASFNHRIRANIVGDKQEGIRGLLDDLLKRLGPDDMAVLASDHGFTELLQGDAVTVAEAEATRAGKSLECVGWRYVEGFAPSAMPEAVEVPGVTERVWMAVGRRWFIREGTKVAPRYSHGGLSLAEAVVPGAVLRRVTAKIARVELLDMPTVLTLREDAEASIEFTVRNSGNVEVEYEVRVVDNLGNELGGKRGRLAQATSVTSTASVLARYRETVTREPDPTGTVTGVIVRLRHTNLDGNWQDAPDGIVTIPVKVAPKTVKFDTEALKGFDDV